jgi:mRNA-degrading endonuclease RelE of RelBE toxin-antitoxin system
LEDLRRKFKELDKDDYDIIKERLEKLEIVSRDGWEQLAVKNTKVRQCQLKR